MPPQVSASQLTISETSPRDYAIQLLATRRLHQSLWLPGSETGARTRVTFSTTSNFDEDLPTILFVGPMFGNRYLTSMFDRQATSIGVRVICVDRPGFGGSTPVPLDQRMPTWLQTIPLLLQHLKVAHVSLVSHSAGTTFTLNTLSQLRHILDPKHPYVAFLGPWVSHKHSKLALWTAASHLPSSLISNWAGINQFVAQKILPAASWSGGVSASLVNLSSQSADTEGRETSYREKYDVGDETGRAIEDLCAEYVFAEGISGGNDEARLCLGHASWGECEDYMQCVRDVARKEREGDGGGEGRLTVRLNFAASDIMIGEKGKEYFEACWRQEGIAEVIDMESKQWPGTNHETVLLDFKKGAMISVLKDVKRLSER